MLKLTWPKVPGSSFRHLSAKRRGVPVSHVTTTISQKGLSTANQLGFLLSLRNRRNSKMDDKFVRNSVPPGTPGAGPSNSWQSWIFGVVVTLILPFCRSKWGSFLTLLSQLHKVLGTMETATEVAEEAAEKMEEITDKIGDGLPKDGKLKGAFDRAEKVAKEIAEDAHRAHEFIQKVEEVEGKLETFIKPILKNQAAREATKIVDQAKDKTTT